MLGITSSEAPSMRLQRVWMVSRKTRYSGECSAAIGPSPWSVGASKLQPAAFAASDRTSIRRGCSGLGDIVPLAMNIFGSCARWRSSNMAFIRCPPLAPGARLLHDVPVSQRFAVVQKATASRPLSDSMSRASSGVATTRPSCSTMPRTFSTCSAFDCASSPRAM